MNTIFTLLLIVAGLVAASNPIVARLPESKKLFDRLAPWSGWIGVVLFVIAALNALKYVLPHLGTILSSFLGWVSLATVVVALLLGFLLGFGLVGKWAEGKNSAALGKGERLRARLATVQIPLGAAGIALGIFALV